MSQSSFFCIFQLGDAGGNLREARGLLEEALLAAPDQVIFCFEYYSTFCSV